MSRKRGRELNDSVEEEIAFNKSKKVIRTSGHRKSAEAVRKSIQEHLKGTKMEEELKNINEIMLLMLEELRNNTKEIKEMKEEMKNMKNNGHKRKTTWKIDLVTEKKQ